MYFIRFIHFIQYVQHVYYIYVFSRGAGNVRRAVAHGADLLCWEDGALWRRIRLDGPAGSWAHLTRIMVDGATTYFSPPHESKRDGGDGTCVVDHVAMGKGRVTTNTTTYT